MEAWVEAWNGPVAKEARSSTKTPPPLVAVFEPNVALSASILMFDPTATMAPPSS